ncbi:gamma-glutamyl-gamma-aminobutyrate hydrolase family protein [Streptococcus sp. X16XC17]|uniref:gamma-glutamyl-gamma-aminobutyrate hydrolase family protein n=1 Tax=unclassified Streptococcus TaxID=2608887 RepID=UPI00066FCE8A|nr:MULTISPECIES: gamma-glutamyl-gamma-aminobutyrate hydrolase family protein [unclassified Streptococcus]TCD45972.1 gamma-glutamyl-gamma-aminobutyrate hydrolase family protein [Streptococcus sp. X16XC17]
MAKVVIGISGNEKEMPAMSGIQYVAVAKDLSENIKEAGGLPIVLPVGHPDLAKDYVAMIDKLALSGGRHVEPELYGEEKVIVSEDYSPERDAFELALIKEALKQGKPIFAICRGMQLLNVALGGSLYQSIEHHWQENVFGTSHGLEIKPESRVAQVFNKSVQVNSLHQQSIKQLGEDLVATAWDPRDGTIEAYEGKRILGLQWHPEFLIKTCDCSRNLFECVVNEL